MPAYRFYRLDGAGKIEKAEWVAADDDEQAMKLARAKARAGTCRGVWDGPRLVGRT